jgi:biopolymer transport protein ExbD
MPVSVPQRRHFLKPMGKLRSGPFSHGKKSGMISLNLTAMVDMFTVIVIFLLQSFAASGELNITQKDLVMPGAKKAELLAETGPVITLFQGTVLVEGKEVATQDKLDEAEQGIPELTEQLKAVREREEKLAERLGKPRDPTKAFDGHIIVQADKTTDFLLVRKVIFSMNSAGWAHVNFAVKDESSSLKPAEGEGAEGAEGGGG